MPKEKLHISRFDGVIGVADSKDLPTGAAYYAQNLDVVTRDGSFVGLSCDEEYSADNTQGNTDRAAIFNDGTEIVTYNGTVLEASDVSDSGTAITQKSPSVTESVSASYSPAMVSSGDAVHVGFGPDSTVAPKWVGRVFHEQFGNAASTEPIIEDHVLTSQPAGWCNYDQEDSVRDVVGLYMNNTVSGSGALTTVDTYEYDQEANFALNHEYTWYVSLVYNGTDEAPLKKLLTLRVYPSGPVLLNALGWEHGPIEMVDSGEGSNIKLYSYDGGTTASGSTTGLPLYKQIMGFNDPVASPANGLSKVTFILSVRDGVNRRVSSAKIYRSSRSLESSEIEESEPVYVARVSLTDKTSEYEEVVSGEADAYTWTTVSTSSGYTHYFNDDDTYYYTTITDDGGFSGGTFEDETGYTHALGSMDMRWGLSCTAGGRHIIGKCYTDRLLDTNSYLFRSKPYRFCTFDWSNDYLVLPEVPVAIEEHRGKIFAFSTGKVYVIDPFVWDIEQTWDGAGTFGPNSVVSCEAGLFWLSNTGVYKFDSALLDNIGRSVLRLQRPLQNNTSNLSTDIGWLSRSTAYSPVLGYDATVDSLVAIYRSSTTDFAEYVGLMFHIPTGRWVPLNGLHKANGTNATTLVNKQIKTRWTNKDGHLILGASDGTAYRLFTSTTVRRPWRYVSRNLGEQGAEHTYYHAYIGLDDSGRVPAVYYYVDDPDYNNPKQSLTRTEEHTRLSRWELTQSSQSWERSRDFAIEMQGAADTDCTDITLIRRRVTPR